MCKNGDFRHISGIFGRKKIFLKNRARPYFDYCYYAFLNKQSVKTIDEISRKCQKIGFSGIFPAFSAGKKFFSKIGLGHIMGIANTHLCAKNQKKLMMKSRENAKKSVFPAYFRHFRPEKNVFRKSGSVTF